MSGLSRHLVVYPGAVLVVFAAFLIGAPVFVTPLFDSAVSIAGMPGGLVLMGAFWLTVAGVGAISVRLLHRASPGLGEAGAVVIAAIVFCLLAPSIIEALRTARF